MQNIKARERLTYSEKGDRPERKAGTENKTENGYIGKSEGDYTEHGVIDFT